MLGLLGLNVNIISGGDNIGTPFVKLGPQWHGIDQTTMNEFLSSRRISLTIENHMIWFTIRYDIKSYYIIVKESVKSMSM